MEKPTNCRFSAWLQFYQGVGATKLNFGVAVMRKRRGTINWQRFEDLVVSEGRIPCSESGDQIERIFAAEDLSEFIGSDADLLDKRWRLHPAHLLQSESVLENGVWNRRSCQLISTQGVGFVHRLDAVGNSLLDSFAKSGNLREAVLSVSNATGFSPDAISPTCMAIIRALIRDGLVVPL